MSHLRPVPTGPPSEEGGSVGAHLAELLRRASRGDEGAFAEWYDATSARAFGLAVRVLRDRAQAEEVTQESYLECWRHAARFDPAKGSADLLAADDRAPQGRRPGPLGRGVRTARRGVRPAEQTVDARLDRRGGGGVARGDPGPHGTGRPDHQAARGRRAGVPRRLHPYRGGHDARPPDRHRQDPDQGRPDPPERRARRRRGGTDA